jgi:hypothetical protein
MGNVELQTKISFQNASLSNEAIKFIATFLRFEYALKENGFCPKDGDACVEWGRVIKELGETFYESVRRSGHAETIMRKPPKKQISRDSRLKWKSLGPPQGVDGLFLAIRRVRNNLLHGGKSRDRDDDNDPARNERLVREAQWIIEEALRKLEDVRIDFEGP